jgi:hypothetical protein
VTKKKTPAKKNPLNIPIDDVDICDCFYDILTPSESAPPKAGYSFVQVIQKKNQRGHSYDERKLEPGPIYDMMDEEISFHTDVSIDGFLKILDKTCKTRGVSLMAYKNGNEMTHKDMTSYIKSEMLSQLKPCGS